MLFTILLMICLKKANISGKWSKYFNKELVMNKEDNEGFKNSTKFWICDNDYIDNDV